LTISKTTNKVGEEKNLYYRQKMEFLNSFPFKQSKRGKEWGGRGHDAKKRGGEKPKFQGVLTI